MTKFSIVPYVLLGTSTFGVTWSGWQLIRCARAARWPRTTALITSARVVRRRTRNRVVDDDYVTYRYSVNGEVFHNDRMRFGYQITPTSIVPEMDPEPPILDANRAFRQGGSVEVYYNPARPQESVIDPEAELPLWALLLVSVVFGIVGANLLARPGV